MASGGKSDDETINNKEHHPTSLEWEDMLESLIGPETARAERSKRFQSQLKDITGEGVIKLESELAAEKLKNQKLTSERNEWKAKYEELEEKYCDEPTVQYQPTNHNLQERYEVVCANLSATRQESADLLKQVAELMKSLQEKVSENDAGKLRIEELKRNQLEMNNNETMEMGRARLQIQELTTQLKESEEAKADLQEILNAVLAASDRYTSTATRRTININCFENRVN